MGRMYEEGKGKDKTVWIGFLTTISFVQEHTDINNSLCHMFSLTVEPLSSVLLSDPLQTKIVLPISYWLSVTSCCRWLEDPVYR